MKTYGIEPKELKIGEIFLSAVTIGETTEYSRKLIIVPAPLNCDCMEPLTNEMGRCRLIPSDSKQGWLVYIKTSAATRGKVGSVFAPSALYDEFKIILKASIRFDVSIGKCDDILFSTNLESFVVRVQPSFGEPYLIWFNEDSAVKLSFTEAWALNVDYGDSCLKRVGKFFKKLR
jgi:hypothetical protein